MSSRLTKILEDHPIIPAIKDDRGLEAVLASDSKIVFVLYGNVVNISDMANEISKSGKMVFINVDLLEGFTNKDIVIDYIKKYTQAEGILSSKASMLKAAKAKGFFTIHRLFVIDSFSFNNLPRQIEISRPDYLEILPGWPKLISWVMEKTDIPIISGGLICCKEDIVAALKAGATAVCSTNPEVWSI